MNDQQYMKLALKEAKKGIGRTSPNPAVGAVIVRNGVVIGKGYHKKAGTPHAEINAINNVSGTLEKATIYVTLEPCSHTGKTPPCCEAIAQTGINKVVIGMTDPNPLVNGQGVLYLRDKGIEVVTNVLEKECEAINAPFLKYIQTSVPYMVMKAGVSLDGRLNYQSGVSGWITGEKSIKKVHHLRDQFDAIMVGAGTIIADNPSLTTRLKGRKFRNPIRIILDTHLNTSLSSKVYNHKLDVVTIVVCSNTVKEARKQDFQEKGVQVIAVDQDSKGLNLTQVLKEIGAIGICSVLVEGGSAIHGSLLREQLYDFAYLFYGPVFAGNSGQALMSGVNIQSSNAAPRVEQPIYQKLGEDMLVSGKISYPD